MKTAQALQVHRPGRGRQRARGAALLLALLAATLLPLSTLALLRAASSARLAQRLEAEDAVSRGLARDATPLLLSWARAHASADWVTAAAPSEPDLGIRALVHMEPGPEGWMVRIDAVDLSGRLHVGLLDSAAAATAIPPEIAARIDRRGAAATARRGDPARTGAGSAAARSPNDQTDRPSQRAPLLESVLEPPEMFEPRDRAPEGAQRSRIGIAADAAHDHWLRSPTAWITTHGSGALNVRSAPIPLLDAALEGLDPALRRALLDQRRTGQPIDASLVRTAAAARRSPRDIELTGSSEAIGFLLRATSPSGRDATWWIVAGLVPDPAASSRVPRLRWAIVEWRRIAW